MNATLDQPDASASHAARSRRRILGASPAFVFILLLVMAVTAVTVQYINYSPPGCNAVRQARVMRAARKDAERIQPELRRNPLFQNVMLSDFTMGTCGCMSVRGIVANEADALQLRDQLTTYHLPYEVKFYLEYSDGRHIESETVPDIPIFTPDNPQ